MAAAEREIQVSGTTNVDFLVNLDQGEAKAIALPKSSRLIWLCEPSAPSVVPVLQAFTMNPEALS
jgi:hypothetical protein